MVGGEMRFWRLEDDNVADIESKRVFIERERKREALSLLTKASLVLCNSKVSNLNRIK